MPFGFTQFLWTLGGAGTLFLVMRFAKIGVWLLMRPGGWAVVVAGLLVLAKAMDGQGTPAELADVLPAAAGAVAGAAAGAAVPALATPAAAVPATALPDRALAPPPMRP
ncbi:hypothetical protein V8J36_03035 [Frigidibacter sp. MR17.14]|uniref:hypothetical protein n=1 Tax=Frigidibacter sp. MR17.14 TaxID=3126509 RepID=UPI003012C6C4